MDNSYSEQRAVIVKEVSGAGITSGPIAIAKIGLNKGDAFPDDGSLLCAEPEAIPLSPKNFWRVTYSFAPDGANTTDRDSNLLKNPPKYQWSIGTKSEPIDRDIDGNPITNSAGDPPDPPPQRAFPIFYLTIKRYESAPFNFQDRGNYVGKVNKGDMTIQGVAIKEGQLFCSGIAPTGEYTMQDKIIEVGYNFELDWDSFDFTMLDQGFKSWYTPGRKSTKQICEIFQPPDPSRGGIAPVQVSKPVLLNGRGKPIFPTLISKFGNALEEAPDGTARGAALKQFSQNKVFYLTYQTSQRVDFSPLGL
jgi:hypothetical protein